MTSLNHLHLVLISLVASTAGCQPEPDAPCAAAASAASSAPVERLGQQLLCGDDPQLQGDLAQLLRHEPRGIHYLYRAAYADLPLEVRVAAVRALAQADGDEVLQLLQQIQHDASLAPELRDAAAG